MDTRLKLATVALAGVLVIAAPGTAAPNKGQDTTAEQDCDGGKIVYTGPASMWPPNHKYRALTVEAIADDPEDEVTLATEGTHDEYVEGVEENGAGNTADDVNPATDADSGTGSATTAHEVRSERSGRGDGRTYTITAQATFGMGNDPCMAEFTIEVPHDMGKRPNG